MAGVLVTQEQKVHAAKLGDLQTKSQGPGTPPGDQSSSWDAFLPLQGMRVWSLVGELGSCMLCGGAKCSLQKSASLWGGQWEQQINVAYMVNGFEFLSFREPSLSIPSLAARGAEDIETQSVTASISV